MIMHFIIETNLKVLQIIPSQKHQQYWGVLKYSGRTSETLTSHLKWLKNVQMA